MPARGDGDKAEHAHAAANARRPASIYNRHMLRLAAVVLCACGAAAQPGNRVVVVSIDGLMPDAYTHPEAHGLTVPTLRSLVARGMSASKVEGVFPTVTYPSHTTLATGVPPQRHGILTNKPADPLDKNFAGWRWYAEDIAVPTLWRVAEAQHLPVALVTWPVTVGAAVTWRVPEYWRAGGPDDQKLLRALSTPGLLDRVAQIYPELWKRLTPPDVLDDAQFAIATYLLTHEHPALVMVHAWALDDAQHEHGPWSREAIAAIEHADELLGKLLATLEAQPEWARTTFVVVSDHGFAPVEHEIRLNALFAQHHLIELDADGKTTKASVAVIANGGSAFVYASDPAARAEAERAINELGPAVAKVYTRDELVAAGGDRDVTFALAAAPTFAFGDRRTGPVIVDTPGRGTHGWPPTEPAMASSFLAIGPRVPHRELGAIKMVDIAPTLASWLGVSLPDAAGTALR
jgi:predicted AlkP superfamily pyrophosphatase or phosphodiesterase